MRSKKKLLLFTVGTLPSPLYVCRWPFLLLQQRAAESFTKSDRPRLEIYDACLYTLRLPFMHIFIAVEVESSVRSCLADE